MTDISLDESKAREQWMKHVPPPPAKAAGIDWHVFISYRSTNRKWALALYDTLKEAGYDIFLDQFQLAAGVPLEESLTASLNKSASAVLVWTNAASDSKWVMAELRKMRSLKTKRPAFHYVIARLDETELPFLEAGDLYTDFTQYPDGPRGGELLRLLYGLSGKPLDAAAVLAVQQLDEDTTTVLHDIAAALSVKDAAAVAAIGRAITPSLVASPVPICTAAEALISMKAFPEALEVLAIAHRRFPSAIRPLQLFGLAYRRQGNFEKAVKEYFSKLHAAGHRDPETLGMYAACLWGLYSQTGDKLFLARSQDLYAQAFRLVPTDSYVGINAASKAILMGHLDEGRRIASEVLELVKDDEESNDYYKMVTLAEVYLDLADAPSAAKIYRKALIRFGARVGDLESTRTQMTALVGALQLPPAGRQLLADSLDPNKI
jgi:tetratricopeptide (TPR) repeat protein